MLFSPNPCINFVYKEENKYINTFKVNRKADEIIYGNFDFTSSIFKSS